MKRLSLLATAIIVLAGCSQTVQTTSGKDYLSKHRSTLPRGGASIASTSPDTGRASTDIVAASEIELIRQAASVEPLLTFPARFGLARIEQGQLTSIPDNEAAQWNALAQRFTGFGTFTPVDPVIAEFTSASLPPATSQAYVGYEGHRRYNTRDLPSKIRLGAARQHLDAVLIYEIGMEEKDGREPLTVVNLTILGSTVLSDRTRDAAGAGKAILLDVRNGYPYGTAQIEKDLTGYTEIWHTTSGRNERREKARSSITVDLVREVEGMMRSLVNELQAKQLRGNS